MMIDEDKTIGAVVLGEDTPPAELGAVMKQMEAVGSIMHDSFSTKPMNVGGARKAMQLYSELSQSPATDITVRELQINNCKASWFYAQDADPDCRILYLHGGGYVMGSITDHSIMLSWLAAKTKCSVLAIDYRLAPEHPFPAGLHDALAAYEYLLANGPTEKNNADYAFVVGDSAGGGLSLSLAYETRDRELRTPDALVCIAPWVDVWFAAAEQDIDPATLVIPRAFAEAYSGNEGHNHPLVSPLFGDPAGLMPILLQVGEDDMTGMIDSVAFARKAKAAGVDVRLEVWRHMPHVWHAFAPFLPDAEKAFDAIAVFLDRQHPVGEC